MPRHRKRRIKMARRKNKSAADILFFRYGFYIDIIVILWALISEFSGSNRK